MHTAETGTSRPDDGVGDYSVSEVWLPEDPENRLVSVVTALARVGLLPWTLGKHCEIKYS